MLKHADPFVIAIDNAELGNLTGLLAKIKPAVEATSYSGERLARNYAFERGERQERNYLRDFLEFTLLRIAFPR
jgi:hypothetical protein